MDCDHADLWEYLQEAPRSEVLCTELQSIRCPDCHTCLRPVKDSYGGDWYLRKEPDYREMKNAFQEGD